MALALVLTAAGNCNRQTSSGPPPSTSAAALEAVPAPSDLVAEVVVQNPERSWSALRGALGDDAILVPRTVGGLAVSLFGLPLRAAQEFDEKLPAFAALSGAEAPRATLALHVRDGGTFVVLLTSGADASFDLERKDGLARLIPRPTARSGLLAGAALGVVGNYLLIGNDVEALAALGPYLVRTVAPRQLHAQSATADAPSDAVLHGDGGHLGALVKRALEHRVGSMDGSAPAEVGPLFDLSSAALDVVEPLTHAELTDVTLKLDKERFRLDALVRLPAGSWSEAPSLSVPTALAALPEDTVAAVAFTEPKGSRKDAARKRATTLASALAEKTNGTAFDRSKLEAALVALGEGRGEQTILGARCSGAGLTGFATGDVADRAKLKQGVRDLLGLRSEDAVAAALDKAALGVTVETGRLELVTDDVTLIRFAPKKPEAPRTLTDLRFTVGETRFTIGAGVETVDTLQALYRPDQTQTLAALPKVRDALAGHEERATFAMIVDPVAVAGCSAGAPAPRSLTPITASLAPVPHGLHVRIDTVPAAISVIGRLLR